MPRIGFRVACMSEPFDNHTKIEVTFDIVVRLGGTRAVTQLTHTMHPNDICGLPEPGVSYRTESWARGDA